jgi:hypothetical protein
LKSSYPVALSIDSDSNIYVSGIFDRFSGYCGTLKYDTNGNELYEILTSESDYAPICKAVGIDTSANLYSVQYIANIPDGSLFFFEKYDSSGEILWATRINNPDCPHYILVLLAIRL